MPHPDVRAISQHANVTRPIHSPTLNKHGFGETYSDARMQKTYIHLPAGINMWHGWRSQGPLFIRGHAPGKIYPTSLRPISFVHLAPYGLELESTVGQPSTKQKQLSKIIAVCQVCRKTRI